MTNTVDIYQLLQQNLSPRTLILTPNSRLSTVLLANYAQYQPNVFIKPAIMPYSSWLEQTIKSNSQADKVVLSTKQSYELWLSLVDEQYFAAGLAKDLQRAWNLCHQWSVVIDKKTFDFNHETQFFYRLSCDYQDKLNTLNAIDECQLVDYLTDTLGVLAANYEQVIWVNFNQFTPQQQHLQQWLCKQTISQHYHQDKVKQNDHYQLACDNQNEQYQQMIVWLKQRLAAGDDTICVAVADLTSSHHRIERVLSRYFSRDEYDISMGQALTSYPLVSQALLFLKCLGSTIENHQARLILTSPYLAFAQSERNQRFTALNQLSCLQQPSMKLANFIKQLKTITPKLYQCLNQFNQFTPPKHQTPSQWALTFKQLLHRLGYPGEQGLNSEQFQCFQRFERSIDELIHYDLTHTRLGYSQALQLLQRHCDSSLFQPQITQAKIQILGLLEASGLHVDSLWVMNMTEQSLPHPVNLSPFIPYLVQKELHMPYSNHQHELTYAKNLLQGLINNSKHIVFSYTQFNEDIHCQPCIIIKDYPVYPQALNAEEVAESQIIETIEDNVLSLTDNDAIKGGTFILKDQALCPFKAFAKYRLHAKATIDSSEGLSALDRGTLIHHVLELVWMQLKTQQNLLNLSDDTIKTIINESIDNALVPMIKRYPDIFTSQFKTIEQQRLFNLCWRWLALEKQRPPFEVDALEQQQSLTLNNLVISMRVDRIDKLNQGGKLVIDYKTGNPSPSNWFDQRPSEPQLPMYSLCDEEITALTFAQLKSSELKFNGVCAEDIEIKNIKPLEKSKSEHQDWQQQRQQWLSHLTELANEFQQGQIQIKPQKPSVCQQCDFGQICRINYKT